MKKSSFIVWWLVIELLIKLLKAHLLLNKIKQKKNNYKPPSPLSGYKLTSRLSCLGSGADVSLNLCHALCQWKCAKELPWDQETVTTDFNSPGPSLVSSPLTESLKQVSYFGKICPFNLSSDNHENDNDLTKLNTRNQIYLLNSNKDQRNATVK